MQNSLLKMLSLMRHTKIIKEVDDYRAGFWEALSDLRTRYLILNSEFPGFCSVFYDLVFLEAFCIFWCLVAAGCFFFFFSYKMIIALWPSSPAAGLFFFDWLFLLMNWNLEMKPLWSVVIEVYFQACFVLFLPGFPHFSPLP